MHLNKNSTLPTKPYSRVSTDATYEKTKSGKVGKALRLWSHDDWMYVCVPQRVVTTLATSVLALPFAILVFSLDSYTGLSSGTALGSLDQS
jgi:hypothetical protein